jgi:hypothetical protein
VLTTNFECMPKTLGVLYAMSQSVSDKMADSARRSLLLPPLPQSLQTAEIHKSGPSPDLAFFHKIPTLQRCHKTGPLLTFNCLQNF